MLTESLLNLATASGITFLASCFIFLLAGLYVGWVFYSRWQNRAIELKAAAKAHASEEAEAQRQFNLMGGTASPSSNFMRTPTASKRAPPPTSVTACQTRNQ